MTDAPDVKVSKKESPIDQCVRCGHPRVEHFIVSGAFVPTIRICPTSVFRGESEVQHD